MLLFFFGICCKLASSANKYDRTYGPSTSTFSGVIDRHLNNKEELKNYLSQILQGYDGIDSIIKRAQLSSFSKIEYKFDESDYDQFLLPDFVRTFSLKATLLRSIKNKDGSYDVKHSQVVTKKKQYQKAYKLERIIAKYPGSETLVSLDKELLRELSSLYEISKEEIYEVYNEMISATNNHKAEAEYLFKLH